VAISQAAMKKSKPADLEAIKALVGAAAGIDPARGDQIQVMIRPFEPVSEETPPVYEAPWFAMVLRYVVALIGVLLVLLLGVKPLARALKREPGERAPGEATPAAAIAQSSADPAMLGRQVGLAQRIVEEKPEDALVALRKMLGTPNAEAAQ
jgi:flagellar M-ring protein FliF